MTGKELPRGLTNILSYLKADSDDNSFIDKIQSSLPSWVITIFAFSLFSARIPDFISITMGVSFRRFAISYILDVAGILMESLNAIIVAVKTGGFDLFWQILNYSIGMSWLRSMKGALKIITTGKSDDDLKKHIYLSLIHI